MNLPDPQPNPERDVQPEDQSAPCPETPRPETSPANEPDAAAVQRFLMYSLSLPERALRTSVGLVGGAVREATALLVPQAFQNSKTYEVMIRQTLDFLIQDVGRVETEQPGSPEEMPVPQPPAVDNFLARKAVGNFVDTAGFLTFHVSPLTILAILSDVAYGSKSYLRELAEELKKEGLIDESSSIHNVDDLLEAVADASSHTASTMDTPPLSIEGLRDTVEKTRAAVTRIDPTKVIPQAELERMWSEMHTIARQQDVGLLTVSSTMTMHALDKVATVGRGTLSGVKVAANMFDRHIISHYGDALSDIRTRGIYQVLAEIGTPYVTAVWFNFSSETETITEDVVSGRLIGRLWRRVFGGKQAQDPKA